MLPADVPGAPVIAASPMPVTSRLMKTWDTASKVSFTGKGREFEVIMTFQRKRAKQPCYSGKENVPQELYKLYFQGLQEYERKENRLHMDFLHGLKSGQEGYPPLGHLRTIDSQNLKPKFYNQRKSDRRNSTAWKRDVRSPEALCWGHL